MLPAAVALTDGRGHEKETDEKGGNDGVPLLFFEAFSFHFWNSTKKSTASAKCFWLRHQQSAWGERNAQ